MSDQEEVLHHQSSAGWVVLASRIPRLGGDTPELAANLVERIDLSRPPVILVAGEPPPGLDVLNEDLAALLGVEPILLDASADPPEELADLSLIVLVGGDGSRWVDLLASGSLGELLLKALVQGGVVLAVDQAAAALGSWRVDPVLETVSEGLGWVSGAVIMPDETEPANNAALRELLEEYPKAYALALARHTLVALGPENEIQVWGEAEPTIIFGPGWQQS
ncbi:MAG: hypothetical protein ACLFWD_12215 [Anaerolineales bacterium]